MDIAIVGAGNVGAAVGRVWAAKGHRVTYGVLDPQAPEAQALRDHAEVALSPQAVSGAEVVVLATPWNVTEAVVKALGSLAGRIVLDCTNPFGFDPEKGVRLLLGYATSGGEQVAAWAAGASVFKSLNQTGFENMADASGYPVRPLMFVAGDDESRKPVVLRLIEELGFEALDAGRLESARLLEPMGMMWVHYAMNLKHGRKLAFALVRR